MDHKCKAFENLQENIRHLKCTEEDVKLLESRVV